MTSGFFVSRETKNVTNLRQRVGKGSIHGQRVGKSSIIEKS